jgi:hypothetical protein
MASIKVKPSDANSSAHQVVRWFAPRTLSSHLMLSSSRMASLRPHKLLASSERNLNCTVQFSILSEASTTRTRSGDTSEMGEGVLHHLASLVALLIYAAKMSHVNCFFEIGVSFHVIATIVPDAR